MRIVLIGANGSVGTEVALRLAAHPDIDLVPVSRTRGGSAYLRYAGVRCAHGDVTDPASAQRLFERATVVATLALPHGDPARARDANRRILDSILAFTPETAVVVFFSTLAVLGEYDPVRRRFVKSQYGRSKRWAESYFLDRASRLGKRACVIRLGHVVGDLQPFTQIVRKDIARGSVTMIDESCPSNVTHTVMVAELLRLLACESQHQTGRYDLLNRPNWTWRKVYEFEAKDDNGDGREFDIVSLGATPPARQSGRYIRSLLAAALRSKLVVANVPRVLERLPQRFEEMVRAVYLRQLVCNSLAGRDSTPLLNPAFYWPPMDSKMFPGMDETSTLLPKWPLLKTGGRWPPDLQI